MQLHSHDEDYDQYEGELERVPAQLSQSSPLVRIDINLRYQIARDLLASSIEFYVHRCSMLTGKSSLSAPYLRLIPAFLPLTEVHIGQSTYEDSLLPYYASAFAAKFSSKQTWTPSLQVMSQALSMISDISLTKSLAVLSNSCILLASRIAMINVYPYAKTSGAEQIKLSSYFAELLRDIVKYNSMVRPMPLSQIEYGEEAKLVCDIVWSSLKGQGVSVRRKYVYNPAYVARLGGEFVTSWYPIPTTDQAKIESTLSRSAYSLSVGFESLSTSKLPAGSSPATHS